MLYEFYVLFLVLLFLISKSVNSIKGPKFAMNRSDFFVLKPLCLLEGDSLLFLVDISIFGGFRDQTGLSRYSSAYLVVPFGQLQIREVYLS